MEIRLPNSAVTLRYSETAKLRNAAPMTIEGRAAVGNFLICRRNIMYNFKTAAHLSRDMPRFFDERGFQNNGMRTYFGCMGHYSIKDWLPQGTDGAAGEKGSPAGYGVNQLKYNG